MKNIFENSNEKLEKIIYDKLDAIKASKEEREKAEYELSIIKRNDEAKIFMEAGIQRCRRKTEYFSVLGVFVEPRKQRSSSQGLVGEENKKTKAWALSLAQIIL